MPTDNAKSIKTRFRAYQLETDGSLFSYWAEGKFTLIEARLTNLSASQLQAEMETCGSPFVDTRGGPHFSDRAISYNPT